MRRFSEGNRRIYNAFAEIASEQTVLDHSELKLDISKQGGKNPNEAAAGMAIQYFSVVVRNTLRSRREKLPDC